MWAANSKPADHSVSCMPELMFALLGLCLDVVLPFSIPPVIPFGIQNRMQKKLHFYTLRMNENLISFRIAPERIK